MEMWPRTLGKIISPNFAHGMLQALTRSKSNGRERAESCTWSKAANVCAAPTSIAEAEISAIQRTRVIDCDTRGAAYQPR
jgi:hypothetical protein